MGSGILGHNQAYSMLIYRHCERLYCRARWEVVIKAGLSGRLPSCRIFHLFIRADKLRLFTTGREGKKKTGRSHAMKKKKPSVSNIAKIAPKTHSHDLWFVTKSVPRVSRAHTAISVCNQRVPKKYTSHCMYNRRPITYAATSQWIPREAEFQTCLTRPFMSLVQQLVHDGF